MPPGVSLKLALDVSRRRRSSQIIPIFFKNQKLIPSTKENKKKKKKIFSAIYYQYGSHLHFVHNIVEMGRAIVDYNI